MHANHLKLSPSQYPLIVEAIHKFATQPSNTEERMSSNNDYVNFLKFPSYQQLQAHSEDINLEQANISIEIFISLTI